jgi:inner membrane protein
MDPVTHALVGMTVWKLTGNNIDLTNEICLGVTIGSVFPDADILLQKWGDYIYLKNHRGITHSFVGNIVSSLLIASLITATFNNASFFRVFLGVFAGCFSHSLIDLFNCYGTKLLWPFYKKKISFQLLMSFDPILVAILLGVLFIDIKWNGYYLCLIIGYFFMRLLMKVISKKKLEKLFGDRYAIDLMPSLRRPFRWHLVLQGSDCSIIGEKSAIRSRIKVYKKLEKINEEDYQKALGSPVGKFFSEFTPIYHVACKKDGETRKYVFSDMRYYYKNDFLHHATIEINKSEKIVNSTFNPYSMKRENNIPIEKFNKKQT